MNSQSASDRNDCTQPGSDGRGCEGGSVLAASGPGDGSSQRVPHRPATDSPLAEVERLRHALRQLLPPFRALRLGGVCAALTGLLLGLGLWPLRSSAPNCAGWRSDRPGLHFPGAADRPKFNPGGLAYTDGPLLANPQTKPEPETLTLELWLRPAEEPHGARARIVSVCSTDGRELFFVGQWRGEVILWVRQQDPLVRPEFRELDTKNALAAGRLSFVTYIADAQGSAVYLNGQWVRRWPGIRLLPPGETLAGKRIFVGNSPRVTDPWGGDVLGLALHGRALSAAEIQQRYQQWTRPNGSPPAGSDGLLALYDLRSGPGPVVPNLTGTGPALVLPARLRETKPVLARTNWLGQGKLDLVLNFVGFVPYGLCLTGWLRRRTRWPWLIAAGGATLIGAAVSLAIELGQGWVPTRDSSWMDLICNTAGALAGAILACGLPVAVLLAKLVLALARLVEQEQRRLSDSTPKPDH